MRTKTPSRKTLTDQATELVEQVGPHVEAARDRIVNDYLPVAQTVLADARDAAREVAQDARVAAQEAAAHAEKSTRKSRKKAAKKAKAKARDLAAAAAATPAAVAVAQKVRPESKKPRRRKRFLLLVALAGAGAFVLKKLRGDTGSSYPSRPTAVPTPPRTDPYAGTTTGASATGASSTSGSAATAPAAGTTDAGAASPGEALADASEEPHEVTTPDRPAEVEDVSSAPRTQG